MSVWIWIVLGWAALVAWTLLFIRGATHKGRELERQRAEREQAR